MALRLRTTPGAQDERQIAQARDLRGRRSQPQSIKTSGERRGSLTRRRDAPQALLRNTRALRDKPGEDPDLPGWTYRGQQHRGDKHQRHLRRIRRQATARFDDVRYAIAAAISGLGQCLVVQCERGPLKFWGQSHVRISQQPQIQTAQHGEHAQQPAYRRQRGGSRWRGPEPQDGQHRDRVTKSDPQHN